LDAPKGARYASEFPIAVETSHFNCLVKRGGSLLKNLNLLREGD